MATPTFKEVAAQYEGVKKVNPAPLGFKDTGPEYQNTCAVRLADAITRVVPDFFSAGKLSAWEDKKPTGRYVAVAEAPSLKFTPAPLNRKLPVNAGEVAGYLAKKLGQAQLVDSRESIRSRLGIVFFDTIPGYPGTGHISLWDGSKVVDGRDFFGRSPRVYFWPLP